MIDAKRSWANFDQSNYINLDSTYFPQPENGIINKSLINENNEEKITINPDDFS